MSADDDRPRSNRRAEHDDAARVYAETLGLDEDEVEARDDDEGAARYDDDVADDDGDAREDDDDLEAQAAEELDELDVAGRDDDEIDDSPRDSTLQDGAAPDNAGGRRFPVRGIALVTLAGGLWSLVAVKRCDESDAPGPAMAVSEEDEPAAEPGPEPAIEIESEPAVPAVDGEVELDEAAEGEVDENAPLPAGSDPFPQPAKWTDEAREPGTVTYTVRHGGSIKNVANLFKIFHHEIQALNPGVGLDASLAPNTRVVVYKRPRDGSSQSIGLPSAGSLEHGVPMLEGSGRQLKAIPWKAWGTAHTVGLLDRILEEWAAEGHAQPVLVGNMSARTGGRLEPHSTHQSGRDVDLGYPQKLPAGEELNWREMGDANLDRDETWALIKLLVQSGEVECIYIDRSLQKLLHDHAMEKGLVDKRAMRKWMEYPRPTGSDGALIQHVKGHIDHMHVRFKCQPGESRCKSR